MIQDIAPHIYHNEYKPVPPKGDSVLLCYTPGNILLKQENRDSDIVFPRFAELEGKLPAIYNNYTYLFTVDDTGYYLVHGLDPELLTETLLPGYSFHDVRVLRTAQPQHLAFAGITGHQLFQWYNSRRFCGHCGAPMVHSETERQMRCPACGHHEYPVLSPAVIVGITNGDKIILSKYEGRNFKRYALIAGFAEIGETIEETVQREVMEEVGLKVKNLRYYKSQPWSFSGTLLFGFFCDVDGTDALTVDHSELSMAEWFDRDHIPDQGNNISLTKEMMMLFAAGKEPK